jgi:hypothetical protein
MSADEIIKHIPEIASATKVVAAAVPFTAIVKRMLGPAADELAEMWRDQVRLYRYERQLKCVEKAEKMAKDAGFTPQAVPPKILFPLLEGASFEEDEGLHTMWAALLANAASPENAESIRPGFISLLKHMAPDEAALINWIGGDDQLPGDGRFNDSALREIYVLIGFSAKEVTDPFEQTQENYRFHEQFLACRDNLLAAQLLYAETSGGERWYSSTSRAHLFLKLCRPPNPKA